MPERTGYAAGIPSWADVFVPDLEPAKAFYGPLFGWEFETGPEELFRYTICTLRGWRVAGMRPFIPGQPEYARWNVLIASDDVDQTAEAVELAGGTVAMGPVDAGTEGRLLAAQDPQDVEIRFWQPWQHTGAQLVNEPGTMVWNEIATRDPQATDRFYQSLFPYEISSMADRPGTDYALYSIDGQPAAGRIRMTEEWGDTPPHWLTYFVVTDAEAAVEQVARLGGTTVHGPRDVPYGRFAVCLDPFGARFAVIASADR